MATENTHYGAEAIRQMLCGVDAVYFIGIGGINMSSLADITRKQGYRVGGSDRARSALTDHLVQNGVEIFYEHRAEQIDSYGAVVYTVAISADNPEYVAARQRGIPCISRADYMGYLMTAYARRVGISGMHGKSSCTAMCAQVWMQANTDPTVLCGAELAAMGGAYRVGEGEHFLFEACEYMDSFLDFSPNLAIILNIEMDHVDYFHSMAHIRSSFASFAAKTGKDGYAVYNADDAEVTEALASYEGNRVRFGIECADADMRAVHLQENRGRYAFDLFLRGEFLCHVALSVCGRHQVYNALACAAAAWVCGISAEQIAAGLQAFCGAMRRMEYKGKLNGADVYDDYGHHPTEVKTTLEGAMHLGKGALWCVFQPHTYSRTAALLADFAKAFDAADRVIVADIYAARETDTMGVSASLLAERIGARARYGGDWQSISDLLCAEVEEEDTVVVMGAGDTGKLFAVLPLDHERKEV